MSTSRRYGLVMVVIGLLATSCGDRESELRAELRDDGMSAESADCVVDGLVEAGVDLDELDSTSNPDDFPPEASAELASCMGDIFAEMIGEGFEEMGEEFAAAFEDIEFDESDFQTGSSFDSADLPALEESCLAGDNSACDDLWIASPIGSEAEEIAESCGGRSTEVRMGSCEFWLE